MLVEWTPLSVDFSTDCDCSFCGPRKIYLSVRRTSQNDHHLVVKFASTMTKGSLCLKLSRGSTENIVDQCRFSLPAPKFVSGSFSFISYPLPSGTSPNKPKLHTVLRSIIVVALEISIVGTLFEAVQLVITLVQCSGVSGAHACALLSMKNHWISRMNINRLSAFRVSA